MTETQHSETGKQIMSRQDQRWQVQGNKHKRRVQDDLAQNKETGRLIYNSKD